MRELVLTFAGTHDAIRAERTLSDAGLAVRVMNVPSVLRAGCGLALRVSPEDAPRALLLLAHIPLAGLYIREAGRFIVYEEETADGT